MSDSEKMRKVVGTPYYIAPEVLKSNYNSKCDVWSCGVLMHILLSGRPPFDGNSNQEILDHVAKGSINFSDPALNNVSAVGKDLLQKLLSAD